MVCKFLMLTALVGISVAGFAQPAKIDTDRPDQTESAFIVAQHWLQFELGLNLQKNTATEKEYLLPTILSKYGLTKRMELRLITTLLQTSLSLPGGGHAAESGVAPVEVGMKIALAEERNWFPKTSLLFHLALPGVASKNLKADKLAPNFRLSMQHSITNKMAVGYNLGAEWDGFTNKPGWVYTLSPGFDLSEKWYAYIEAFGVLSKTEVPQHSIDGGLAYYIDPNCKVDISSGFGISSAAPQWYLAVGASIRFSSH